MPRQSHPIKYVGIRLHASRSCSPHAFPVSLSSGSSPDTPRAEPLLEAQMGLTCPLCSSVGGDRAARR